MKKAILALADGTIFEGQTFDHSQNTIGEVVFNTQMVGYQKIMTDPSYIGQIVVMTYPLIGNYGINPEDSESLRPWVKGMIVRELCDVPSNFRMSETLNSFADSNRIPLVWGIDTRALTRHIRDKGAMNGILVVDEDFSFEKYANQLAAYKITNPAMAVCVEAPKHYAPKINKVALLDCGYQKNILDALLERRCEVTVYPANATAEEILSYNPDGLILSNGPGDPKDCSYAIDTVKALIGKLPMLGICLGHQIMALAEGADTVKMKFGHRGANHPVKDLAGGRTYITVQNHGYVIDPQSLNDGMTVTHTNINDGTVEGLEYAGKQAFSVQFHPEATKGPNDTTFLFDKFIKMMEERSNA